MRESGRHMKVMEKTQNVVRGVNNVKKQTDKQSIKLTFFSSSASWGMVTNPAYDLQSSRCIEDYLFLPLF